MNKIYTTVDEAAAYLAQIGREVVTGALLPGLGDLTHNSDELSRIDTTYLVLRRGRWVAACLISMTLASEHEQLNDIAWRVNDAMEWKHKVDLYFRVGTGLYYEADI